MNILQSFGRLLSGLLFVVSITVPALSMAQTSAAIMSSDQVLKGVYQLFGRLHPVIVHVPIGLIVFIAALELFYLLRLNRGYTLERSVYPYVVGALFSVLAVLSGWVNSEEQELLGELKDALFIHRWGGLVVSGLALGIALVGSRAIVSSSRIWAVLYRSSAVLSAGLVGLVAHFGGLMVHGADYYDVFSGNGEMSEEVSIDRSVTLPSPIARKITFEEDVHPILKANCTKCHGEGKRKGDYSIDSREELIKGGKSGQPAIRVSDSERSYLVELIAGIYPKKIMPSKGRRLTAEEIGIIRAWIDQGASWNKVDSHLAYRIPKVSTEPRTPSLPVSDFSNPIDKIIDGYFKEHDIVFPAVVEDRVFARRAYLDLVGQVPNSSELNRFLSDKAPDKRERLVDALLEDRYGYAMHWMTFWNDALRNDYSGPGFLLGNRKEITGWLFKALLNNVPYDEFVTGLVNPDKESLGFVRGIKWWKGAVVNANEEPSMQAAQNIAQVFMGVNLKCASCHSSFTDEWTLSDAYGFANAIGGKSLETHECNLPTGDVVPPSFLYPELGTITSKGRIKRRGELAALLTSDQNGRFARTFVNRIWEKLFGVGIVEPIDELDNLPWNNDLLDWLASEFVKNDYNVKELLRLIITSQTYQLPSLPAQESYKKDFVFKGPVVRRVTVEQFVDSVSHSLGVVPSALAGDIERAMRITLSAVDVAKRVPSVSSEPRLLYSSGSLSGRSGEVEVEANIGGAESLWLIVIRGYKKSDKLAAQRAQFDLVAKQDAGVIDVLDRSLKARRDAKDHNKKLKYKPTEVADYHAVWGNPVAYSESGSVLSFADTKNITPTIYLDEDEEFIGEGSEGVESQISFDKGMVKTRAFSALRYDIKGLGLERFKAKVKVEQFEFEHKEPHVEFWLVSDLPVRSVFFEANEFTLAMGRPRREQITTRRERALSTMQGLELLSGDGLTDLIERASQSSLFRAKGRSVNIVDDLYFSLLGRIPTKEERELTAKQLENTKVNDYSALQDVIWSLMVSPEFQLLM